MRHNAFMAPRRKKQSDRHKPSFMVRIPKNLRAPLEALADQNAAKVPEMVKRAVVQLLKDANLWPPPPADGRN